MNIYCVYIAIDYTHLTLTIKYQDGLIDLLLFFVFVVNNKIDLVGERFLAFDYSQPNKKRKHMRVYIYIYIYIYVCVCAQIK